MRLTSPKGSGNMSKRKRDEQEFLSSSPGCQRILSGTREHWNRMGDENEDSCSYFTSAGMSGSRLAYLPARSCASSRSRCTSRIGGRPKRRKCCLQARNWVSASFPTALWAGAISRERSTNTRPSPVLISAAASLAIRPRRAKQTGQSLICLPGSENKREQHRLRSRSPGCSRGRRGSFPYRAPASSSAWTGISLGSETITRSTRAQTRTRAR
jgi:hypothetical protein